MSTTTTPLVEWVRIIPGLYRTSETYGLTEWWAEVTRTETGWWLTTTTYRHLMTAQQFRTLSEAQQYARLEFRTIEEAARG